MYNYKESKKKVEEILASPTRIIEKDSIPTSDYEYSRTNGIRTWVGCLFVDISDSHHIFENPNEDTIRVMRSLFSELIAILEDDPNHYEIGIRDDCVYCIYNLSKKEDLVEIFNHACTINTFMKMFNKITAKKGLEPITVGIGLGCDYEMIIKVGEPNSHINDRLWIGNAIGHASYLANIANRNGYEPIALSTLFYDNAIKTLEEETPNYRVWLKPEMNGGEVDFYHCNLVRLQFNQWVNEEV